MDVTVCVGTFGSAQWSFLARERAIPSAVALDVPVIHRHASTLHEARNDALSVVPTEWVCFLDADDELEPGYFDHMAQGTADLRAPSVRYVKNRHHATPRIPRVSGHKHTCTADCLEWGNWLCVGTVAPTELLHDVGGWRDYPVYEDFDLWVRCWKAGATIEAIPRAIYRAHVRPDSRNRSGSQQERNEVHRRIAVDNGISVPA